MYPFQCIIEIKGLLEPFIICYRNGKVSSTQRILTDLGKNCKPTIHFRNKLISQLNRTWYTVVVGCCLLVLVNIFSFMLYHDLEIFQYREVSDFISTK